MIDKDLSRAMEDLCEGIEVLGSSVDLSLDTDNTITLHFRGRTWVGTLTEAISSDEACTKPRTVE